VEEVKKAFSTKDTASESLIAEFTDLNQADVTDSRAALAEMITQQRLQDFRELVDAARVAGRWKGAIADMAGRLRCWDETQHRAGLEVGGNMESKSWHCMLAQLMFFLLLTAPTDNGRPATKICVLGNLPTFLVPLQKQTGEYLRDGLMVLENYCNMDELLRPFKEVVLLSCADRAGANGRVLKHEDLSDAQASLGYGCQLHDCHHCTEETLSLRPRLLPRVARACGSVSLGSIMAGIRTELIHFLRQNTERFTEGSPTAEANAYRAAMLDVWWQIKHDEGKQGRSRQRRMVMERLANGDWRIRVGDGGKVQHFCSGADCCRNDQDCIEQFVLYFVPAVIPKKAISVSQHRPNYQKLRCL
jgi:hypothetical protein